MYRTKRILGIILSFIMLSASGCSAGKPMEVNNKYTIKAQQLAVPVDKISNANNKVAFKFLRETIKSNSKDNIVISPLSLNTILSLTQNGAAGNTKVEMLKALEMEGYDDKTINDSYKNIIAHFNSLKGIETKLGNSVWIEKGAAVKKDFKAAGQEYYEAEINELDFSKKSSVDSVNKWVYNYTAGKIDKIVDSFDLNTYMTLINTVYFKGKWSKPFTESHTKKAHFTNSESRTENVDMMQESLSVEYLKNDSFEAVRIPYEDNNFGMYVFLPNKSSSIDKLMKDMNLESWGNWMKDFKKAQVQVSLPRFKIEFEEKLNDMLMDFGMKEAFGGKADFRNITEETKLYISLVKQKSYIDVNEAGTEAASATAVVMKSVSIEADKPISFTADRPFIYAIADKKTGLIVFMGKVEKP